MGDAVKKNLIYHIYFDGKLNHYHHLNIAYLNKYWNIFDGQNIVKIAVDDFRKPLDRLLDLLPENCIPELVHNDPVHWEADHFINSLKRIDGGMTFYGHCKGVSRQQMTGLDIWVKNLYELNLGRVPDLGPYLYSGICAKLLPCPPYVPYDWHYSGSFYWMNTDKVKERWINKVPFRYYTESFPGMIAKPNECILGAYSSNLNMSFYNERTWDILQQPS